jgi:hypothetical protein
VYESVLRVGAVDVCWCVREFVDHSHEHRVIRATGDVANEGRHLRGSEFIDCSHFVDSA